MWLGTAVCFNRHPRPCAEYPFRELGYSAGLMPYYVYILASRPNGTIYIGVTNDLVRRVYEHKEGLVPGFTRKYGVKRLVYHEIHDEVLAAIQREKSLKRYLRDWKIALIERDNPHWDDLYPAILR